MGTTLGRYSTTSVIRTFSTLCGIPKWALRGSMSSGRT